MRTPVPGPADGAEDRLLADAFRTFRETNRTELVPPPPETVYAVAARRRYRHRVTLAAAAVGVVFLLAPSLLVQMASHQGRQSAEGGPSPSGTQWTTPPPSHPGQVGSPRSTGEGDGSRGPGGHPLHLPDAEVELTALSHCRGGALQFRNGQATDAGGCVWRIGDGPLHQTQFDGVAGDEVVTTFTADGRPGVVALGLPADGGPDGRVRTLGYVVVARSETQSISSTTISADGTIRVEIRDRSPQRQGRPQVRSYRWISSSRVFVQVDEPTGPEDREPEPSAPASSASPSPSLSG